MISFFSRWHWAFAKISQLSATVFRLIFISRYFYLFSYELSFIGLHHWYFSANVVNESNHCVAMLVYAFLLSDACRCSVPQLFESIAIFCYLLHIDASRCLSMHLDACRCLGCLGMLVFALDAHGMSFLRRLVSPL